MKDIINKNSKDQHHGYQEWYGYNKVINKVIYRGNYKNNERIGYAEYHGSKRTNFNII
jgi:hypothetical protein